MGIIIPNNSINSLSVDCFMVRQTTQLTVAQRVRLWWKNNLLNSFKVNMYTILSCETKGREYSVCTSLEIQHMLMFSFFCLEPQMTKVQFLAWAQCCRPVVPVQSDYRALPTMTHVQGISKKQSQGIDCREIGFRFTCPDWFTVSTDKIVLVCGSPLNYLTNTAFRTLKDTFNSWPSQTICQG